MNSRIKELALKCTPAYQQPNFDAEKFAKLIVVECANICYNSGMQDSDAHAQNLLYEFNIDNCRSDK